MDDNILIRADALRDRVSLFKNIEKKYGEPIILVSLIGLTITFASLVAGYATYLIEEKHTCEIADFNVKNSTIGDEIFYHVDINYRCIDIEKIRINKHMNVDEFEEFTVKQNSLTTLYEKNYNFSETSYSITFLKVSAILALLSFLWYVLIFKFETYRDGLIIQEAKLRQKYKDMQLQIT